ncbi:MAG: LysM peptidoglycan-binding domain-containing protein [Phycisphaerales bacterium]|nr:LysM peptidoglycan-binding domain-containing protein [Phycisphaerales bacterium]
MTIRIPSASVLRGEIQQVAAPPIPDAITPSPQSLPEMLATPSDAVPASEREYVVQKGDTLGAIASREMGSAKKWNQLYEANKDRIKGPTDLRIGQPLRIPADS